MSENKYPCLILGLDISTACIGISIIYDDGVNQPLIELISHVSPKIDKNIKGIEALILRKQIFEEDFLNKMDDILAKINCPLKKITDVVIESPMIYSTGGSNAATVATLLQFNGILSDSVYRTLHLVPNYVSSYDARMRSFPELLAIRKFNKKGNVYPIGHIKKAIDENTLTLFGSYPFDCDKKCVMMNVVSEKYPGIPWIYNKKGELKKENYDSCDALVCALAYSNEKRHGELKPEIIWHEITTVNGATVIDYVMRVWNSDFRKRIIIENPKENETLDGAGEDA
jgi:hypothetical protein